MSRPIRIVLVDDHPAICESLSRLLEGQPDLAVVGVAATAQEALRLTLELRPDVLVLDVRMPGPRCSTVVRRVRRGSPATAIVIYTAYDEEATARALLRASAAGFIVKDEPLEDLIEAVRVVAAGGPWFRESLRACLESPDSPRAIRLTPRERAVLEGIVEGLSDVRIGTSLGISDRTVRRALVSIYDKLGVENRVQAAVWAVRYGLLDAGERQ